MVFVMFALENMCELINETLLIMNVSLCYREIAIRNIFTRWSQLRDFWKLIGLKR